MALVFVSTLALVLATAIAYTCDTTPEDRAALAEQLTQQMAARGYHVASTGVFSFPPSHGGFGNNPDSPYGRFVVETTHAHTDGHRYTFDSKAAAWEMNETDVIVTIACAPPRASYASFRSYFFATIDKPVLYFSSMGDSINHLELNSTSGDFWDGTMAVMSTADADSQADVLDSFTAISFASVNTDVIPSELVRMGLGLSDGLFLMLARVAIFENSTAGIQTSVL